MGIDDLHFVRSFARRGALTAPLRYLHQAAKSLLLLGRKRPHVVFVQSPPSPAVIVVFLYCVLTGSHYVIDAHSAAMQRSRWNRPRWLHRLLARRALATIVTNEHFRETLESWGAKAMILRDIPTSFSAGAFPLAGAFNVAVVNSFAFDEPVEAVLAAARTLPEISFYVTGRKSRADPLLLSTAPANVFFTDFLPDEQYYGLLQESDAVMCLTTRDHTMQRGACEALSLGTPIITSDWPLLRDHFCMGTVHVTNGAGSIRQGILEMRECHEQYRMEIRQLRQRRQHEWAEQKEVLIQFIEGVGPPVAASAAGAGY
jgi:glycosyltransferase involved in cell wall biosynthesis